MRKHTWADVATGLLGFACVFMCSVGVLYMLVQWLPSNPSATPLRIPRTLDDVRDIYARLSRYYEDHSSFVVVFFSCLYVFKQTFSIPGSAVLNCLAGAFFGLPFGLMLVVIWTTTGASCCYGLSSMFGRPLAEKVFTKRLRALQASIRRAQDRGNLFFFLLSLRLFPVTPNFALNLCSPIVGVKFRFFWPTVFLGLLPYNFVCVQAGTVLASISSLNDVLTPRMLLQLAVGAIIALVPTVWKPKALRSQNWKERPLLPC